MLQFRNIRIVILNCYFSKYFKKTKKSENKFGSNIYLNVYLYIKSNGANDK